MRKPPFGYRISYNRRLRKDWYEVDEHSRWALVDIFFRIGCNESLEEIAEFLNENGHKTASGRPFTSQSVRTVIKDPFYINLLKSRTKGKTLYKFAAFESLISIEDWIVAQVKINNIDMLKQPDILKQLKNPDYDSHAINFEFEHGTDYYQYMRDKEREEVTFKLKKSFPCEIL